MPDGYGPGRIFPNGSAADFFQDNFCERCARKDCPTVKMIDKAYIDGVSWNGDMSIRTDPKGRTMCVDFFSPEKELMWFYEETFPQTFLGFKLRNTADGCVAESADGLWSLTCGCKANLETQLLVSFPSRAQSAVISVTEGKHGEAEPFPR